jgi:hypothetical protein
MRAWNILNWTVASIAWTCCFYCPKIMFLLTFCQNLTYLKPDLQQSDSSTARAMCHKTRTAPDMIVRTVQNPFSTVSLFVNTGYQRSPKFLLGACMLFIAGRIGSPSFVFLYMHCMHLCELYHWCCTPNDNKPYKPTLTPVKLQWTPGNKDLWHHKQLQWNYLWLVWLSECFLYVRCP